MRIKKTIEEGIMNNIDIPKELIVKGKLFWLNIEQLAGGVLLTYEFTPRYDDLFLIACHSADMETAVNKMRLLLEKKNFIQRKGLT